MICASHGAQKNVLMDSASILTHASVTMAIDWDTMKANRTFAIRSAIQMLKITMVAATALVLHPTHANVMKGTSLIWLLTSLAFHPRIVLAFESPECIGSLSFFFIIIDVL